MLLFSFRFQKAMTWHPAIIPCALFIRSSTLLKGINEHLKLPKKKVCAMAQRAKHIRVQGPTKAHLIPRKDSHLAKILLSSDVFETLLFSILYNCMPNFWRQESSLMMGISRLRNWKNSIGWPIRLYKMSLSTFCTSKAQRT